MKNTQTFSERNAARKVARNEALSNNKRAAVQEARRRRRAYGGTFGLAPNHIFNEMTLGTMFQYTARKGKDPVL